MKGSATTSNTRPTGAPWLAVLFAGVLLVGPVSGQIHTDGTVVTVYVNASSQASSTTTPTANGTSWARAFPNLQDALLGTAVAAATDANPVQVWIAAGTYAVDEADAEATDLDTQCRTADATTCSFVLFDNVALYGGFNGTESAFSSRSLTANVATLTGALTTVSGNAAQVVNCESTNCTTTGAYPTEVDGLVITGASGAANGGGMYIKDADVIIANTTLVGNATTTNGGALYVEESLGAAMAVTISESQFLRNEATGSGAGIYLGSVTSASTVDIQNTIFSGNEADANGGAIYANDAEWNDVRVIHTTFEDNSAANGGAMWFDNATADVDNSIFFDNTATGSGPSIQFDNNAGAVTLDWSLLDDASCPTDVTGCSNLVTSADPLFTSTALEDFTLAAGSRAINTGSNAQATTDGITADLDGTTRPYNSGTVDMGAHEAQLDYDFGDLPAGYNAITLLATDGARHAVTGPYLGSEIDSEEDGATSADAGITGGDDNTGSPDDEDGVSFSTLHPGGKGSAQVFLSGASSAYVNIWIDLGDNAGGAPDDDFTDTDAADGDIQLVDQQVFAGANVISFDIPGTLTSGSAYARVRVTSSTGTSATTGFTGFMADGEVEDYQVTVAAAPVNTVVYTPAGGASVTYDGTDITVTDPNGAIIYKGPPGSTSTTLTGSAGNDEFTFDGAIGASLTLTIDGGSGGTDSIVLSPTSSPLTSNTLTYTNETDGSIAMVFGGFTHTINYQNFDPITDNSVAPLKTFTFSTAGTITLSGDGDGTADDNYSWIDCDGCGEATTFLNPSASGTVVINTSTGSDTINLGLLDTSGGALPTVTVDVNSNAGADTFVVTPASGASGYVIDLDGGTHPGTCPADVLTLDSESTAVVDTYGTPPSDTIEFSSTHQDIVYANIESVGTADVEISVSDAILYATDILSGDRAFEITVTNNGPSDANCVSVTLDPALSEWMAGSSTSGPGSFSDPTWDIGLIANGVSSTLAISGFVTTNVDRTLTFTANAGEDTQTDNNEAEATVSLGFLFPTKAHVNSAVYTQQTIEVGGTTYQPFEQLMVGLFQGSPGITGAVWCEIPTLIDTDNDESTSANNLWPVSPLTSAAVADRWRPCADGLPFPLHVNDFYLDDQGTAGTADDVLWLSTWGSAGLYKSEDGGLTWDEAWPQLGPGDDTEDIFWTNVYAITEDSGGILYISADNGLVYRSLNGGDNWQKVGSLPAVSADTPWSLEAHPSDSGVIYAGTFGKGVYYSDDFGLTWQELDDPATTLSTENENDALLDTDGSGDFAGHIFDLEFSPDGDYLFAGTGYGVWRADLETAGPTATDFTGTWTFMGPTVTLDDASTVVPEVRTLAFQIDTGDADDDLLIGSWGRGTFVNTNPSATTGFTALALRGSHVMYLAVSADGEVTVGSNDGLMSTVMLDAAVSTEVDPLEAELPTAYSLEQNYPNPFNPVTTIAFSVPETGHVNLVVYDVLGRAVETLLRGVTEAGHHEVRFDATELPSGTYMYRLDFGSGAVTRLLTLLK